MKSLDVRNGGLGSFLTTRFSLLLPLALGLSQSCAPANDDTALPEAAADLQQGNGCIMRPLTDFRFDSQLTTLSGQNAVDIWVTTRGEVAIALLPAGRTLPTTLQARPRMTRGATPEDPIIYLPAIFPNGNTGTVGVLLSNLDKALQENPGFWEAVNALRNAADAKLDECDRKLQNDLETIETSFFISDPRIENAERAKAVIVKACVRADGSVVIKPRQVIAKGPYVAKKIKKSYRKYVVIDNVGTKPVYFSTTDKLSRSDAAPKFNVIPVKSQPDAELAPLEKNKAFDVRSTSGLLSSVGESWNAISYIYSVDDTGHPRSPPSSLTVTFTLDP